MNQPRSKIWAAVAKLLLVFLIGQIAVLLAPLFVDFRNAARTFPLGALSLTWALTGFSLAKWRQWEWAALHAMFWAIAPFVLFLFASMASMASMA